MKILFLSRLYYPHIGGVEKHVEMLSDELAIAGHKITILTTRHDNSLQNTVTTNKYKFIRFDQPDIKYLGLIYTWYWMVKNIALFKESDIIHIHDVFIWYWPIRLLLPFKKVYVTFHGQWGKYPISKVDIVQKKVASLLSSGSISIGDYIPKHYGIKTSLISYGATRQPLFNTVKKNLNNLLYVGRLDPEVPVTKILKVFEKLGKEGEFNIQILGDGELRSKAENVGKVYGFVDPNPYYKKAKYVFASGYLTILEALANKCLVFATYDNPLQKDYYELAPFKKFIMIANDTDELYKKFIYLKNNIKEADKLIEMGSKWSRLNGWKQLMHQYSTLWKFV